MNYLVRTSVAAISLALISFPALAQSAPIRVGPGGSSYTTAQDIQSQIARQTADLGNMEARIAQLMGRIEDLELRLANNERSYETMVQTNQKLNEKLAGLTERVAELESRPVVSQQSMSTENTSQSSSPFGGRVTDLRNPGQTGQSAPFGQRSEPDLQGGQSDSDANARNTSTITTNRSATNQQARLPEGSLGTLPASQLPGGAGPLFELGKNRLLNFDYDGAEKAFRAFLEEFGDDAQAGEAHYWLGEVLYQQGDFAGSARFLTTMLQDYPEDPRRGEALVKLARSLREVGEPARACAFLGRLNQVAPDASAVTKNLARVEQQRSKCN